MKRSGTQNTPAVRLENTAVVHCGFWFARRQFVVTSVPKLHLTPLPDGRGIRRAITSFSTDTKTMKTRKHNTAVSRTAVIKFRCSVGEKKIIGQQAAASGKNLSEFCRGQALYGKIYASRKLSSEEKQYFILLKSHNLDYQPDKSPRPGIIPGDQGVPCRIESIV